MIEGLLACGSAKQATPASKMNKDAPMNPSARRASAARRERTLIGRFLILKPSHITDQRADLCAFQFLAKCRHATFAPTHYGGESTGTGDIRILLPPLRGGKIRSLICVTERRIPAPVTAMTTSTIISEQIANRNAARFRGGAASLWGSSSDN